jgi:hypothetical protein
LIAELQAARSGISRELLMFTTRKQSLLGDRRSVRCGRCVVLLLFMLMGSFPLLPVFGLVQAVSTLLRTGQLLDAYRACIIAAHTDRHLLQTTMDRVASSLIEQGLLDDGVEFLTLNSRNLDACIYQQQYGS